MDLQGLVRAWSDERTLHRSERAVIVDKPAGVACVQGPPDANSPRGDLLARLLQHGLGALEPRFVPPERASGLAVLGSSASDPAAWASSGGRIGYVVAVDDWRLPRQGLLPAAREAAAPLEYRVKGQNQARALVEVECEAAPEVVLRAFSRARQPVVGDAEAGAVAGTRCMLHVASITTPLRLEAPLPGEFESWLAATPVRSPAQFSAALTDAALTRFELWPSFEAFVLLSESGGEISGLSVERYGKYAVISVSSEEAWELRERVAECLMDHGAQGVYVKRRVRADLRSADIEALAPRLPLRGTPAPGTLRVRQGALAFWVELGAGLSTGLFLDQRRSWQRVCQGAAGRTLLNLFCYTGAFSVAAAAGGAAQTTSVDLSGRALTRLRHNLDLNELSGERHRLLKSDVPRWLARASRAGQRFDWIVLDPPSFGTRGRGVLSTQRDYATLVRGAAALLEERGSLLCVSHHRKISQRDLAEVCAQELEGARLEPLVGDWDSPTLPGVSAVQSVLATRS